MTEVLLVTLAMLVLAGPANTFEIQAELQGNYDEISQATLQFVTPSDVDLFHEVSVQPQGTNRLVRGQLRRVPPAAKCFDEEDARRQSARQDIDLLTLRLE